MEAHPACHDGRNEEEKGLASFLFETNFRQRDETLQDFCLRDIHGALTVRWQIVQFKDHVMSNSNEEKTKGEPKERERKEKEKEMNGDTRAFEKYCIGRPAAIYHALSRLKFAWYCF